MQNISALQRQEIITYFNSFSTRDEQDSYLSGLVRLKPVCRRRLRNASGIPRQSSFKYIIRLQKDVDVCDTNNNNSANDKNNDAEDAGDYAESVVNIDLHLTCDAVDDTSTNAALDEVNNAAGDVAKDGGNAARDVHNNQPDKYKECVVCYSAFLSLHGITNRRVRTIKNHLVKYGTVHFDKRGKHQNRPHKLSETDTEKAVKHISSFKSRKAHYSRRDTNKLYLPDDLSVRKMHDMFKAVNPTSRVSYNTYLNIFNNKFNISFGYPRTDTCSTCDEYSVKQKDLLKQVNEENSRKSKQLNQEHQLHLRKAETFYERKRAAKAEAAADETVMSIALDFSKNLPMPNISTNDVYYRRQLSFYSFNIHVLHNSQSYYYTYNEMIARKGADDVISMLDHFIFNYVPASVVKLKIFCDSCPGQNKNYSMLRYLHYIVCMKGRLHNVNVIYPVRGHSYLECDKNFGLMNQKSNVEVPADWCKIFESARSRPSPFNVITCEQELFRSYTQYLKKFYKASCPFQTRSVKEFAVKNTELHVVYKRDSYNGPWESFIIEKQPFRKPNYNNRAPPLYRRLLGVSAAKYKDLQVLSKFCSEEAQNFFKNIPVVSGKDKESDSDLSE
jgi:hypothetical protein